MADSRDQLSIEVETHGSRTFVRLRGELDIATAGQVPESVARTLRDGQLRIVVDLRDVRLIDSVGVRALLHIRRRVWRQDGVVAFVCSEEPAGRVLRVMGLYDVLGCTEDLDAAVRRLRADPDQPASSAG
jgi:anti-anti-sigma factor